ncbi:6723_t:CDS:2, partial [Gigaspora rosea]
MFLQESQNMEYMEQENVPDLDSSSDTESGSKEHSDNTNQIKKRSNLFPETIVEVRKKRRFNESRVSMASSPELLNEENINEYNDNYITNTKYNNEYDDNYITNTEDSNKSNNDHTTQVACDMASENSSSANQSFKPNLKDLQLVPINTIPGKSWIWNYYQHPAKWVQTRPQ